MYNIPRHVSVLWNTNVSVFFLLNSIPAILQPYTLLRRNSYIVSIIRKREFSTSGWVLLDVIASNHPPLQPASAIEFPCSDYILYNIDDAGSFKVSASWQAWSNYCRINTQWIDYKGTTRRAGGISFLDIHSV